jgi:hypothetical protein
MALQVFNKLINPPSGHKRSEGGLQDIAYIKEATDYLACSSK